MREGIARLLCDLPFQVTRGELRHRRQDLSDITVCRIEVKGGEQRGVRLAPSLKLVRGVAEIIPGERGLRVDRNRPIELRDRFLVQPLLFEGCAEVDIPGRSA